MLSVFTSSFCSSIAVALARRKFNLWALSLLCVTNVVSTMFNKLGMNVYGVECSFKSEKIKSTAVLSLGTLLYC